MKFRWSVLPAQPLLAGQLASRLGITPILAQCLLNRDLSDAVTVERFLQPRLKQLADPFLLPNMVTAVERLFRARSTNELVLIFGDYDVDGITSTALLLEVLTRLGWRVQHYLPHRLDEGYGLSQQAVENCLKKVQPGVMLAVDCGSTTVDSITLLQGRGVDVIVLDHHQVSSPAPPALALVNPRFSSVTENCGGQKATDKGSLFDELCSAGLAFKLAHALVKRGRLEGLSGANDFDLRPLLDLVAVGTIADLVPLREENRILVAAGLQRLNTTTRPGMIALKQVAQCPERLTAFEVGYQLAPRLNAAGRLETAEEALRLLLAKDKDEARALALRLDATNRERKAIERGVAEEAMAAVHSRFKPQEDFVIVEGQNQWHIGVVGIVASRVVQQFYRPAIIVGGNGAEWRGSGRSISGFDMASALRECGELLIRHGGHAMAAGVAVTRDKIDALRIRLNEVARRRLRPDDLQPRLRLDAEVGLGEITFACLEQLSHLAPAGQGNPPVRFFSRNVSHQRPLQKMGAQKQHVRFWLTDGQATHQAIWWGAGNEPLPVGRFDVAFIPQLNQFNQSCSIQLKVLDWRQAAEP